MPHLHLPIDHTDADLVLAANLAEVVGSEDLYVTWTHGAVRGRFRRSRPCCARACGELLGAVRAGFAAFWRAMLGKPSRAAIREDADAGAGRESVR